MRKIAVALLAGLALLVPAIPAQADADATEVPTIAYPLPPNVGDRVVVQIEGPDYIWGIRVMARYYDSISSKLTVYTRGTCAQRPEAYCVKVYKVYEPESGFSGLAWFYVGQEELVIHLNTYYRMTRADRRHVGRHEFSHTLGFLHHTQREGLMSVRGWYSGPSRAEIAEFLRVYGGD